MKTSRDDLIKTVEELQQKGFDYLIKITAVDYVQSLTVIYFLRKMADGSEETVEVELNPVDAWVPTLIKHFRAADWYEREMAEMFAIEIKGRQAHRLLLEKWDGVEAPLRKSFQWAQPYKSDTK